MGKRKKDVHLKVDDVFGIFNCIKLSIDADKFRNWLKKEHSVQTFDEFFHGYKFFIESAIRTFLYTIIYNSSLDIKEDFVFYRARFTGINVSKIPNTCEKTILIKNILERLRLIKKAESWIELSNELNRFKELVLDIFEKIFNDYVGVSPNVNITKEEALNYVTRFYTYIYLNNTSQITKPLMQLHLDEAPMFIPKGYWVSILDNGLNSEQHNKCFEGYKYSLQFLWSMLLNDKCNASCIKNLHKSKNWYKEDNSTYSKSGREEVRERYDDLDSYFGKIKIEIIEPMEKDLGIDIWFDKVLYFKNKIAKSLFKNLLTSKKDTQLNQKETLDYELLWYPVEFLDSSKSPLFNGIPAFISLLAGTAEVKKIYGEGEKAYVCKFIHPNKSVNGNDFSYGVLIESFESAGFSDYSGWILFFDSCGDYSGFSGSQHAMAEMFIDEYKKRNLLEIREKIIDKDHLKKYIADKIVSREKEQILFELDEESRRNLGKNTIAAAKGLINELIAYYILSKKKYDLVDWNLISGQDQLDVVFETTNDFLLVECKSNSNNIDLDDEIEKLKRKLSNYDTDKNKKCAFWFWNRPNEKIIEKLTNKGIEFEVISELINNDPNWENKEKDKLKLIFKEMEREGRL